MFVYCRNNAVRRKDVSGTTDVDIFDDDSNLLDDDELIHGGTTGGGGGTGGSGGPAGNSSPHAPSGGGGNGNVRPGSVDDFLTSNGQNPKDILESFSGDPQLQELTEDTTVFRFWGGTTAECGHWVSP